MPLEPDREKLIDSLWTSYITDVAPDPTATRAAQAVEVLDLCHEVYKAALAQGDEDRASLSLQRGRAAWALLANEKAYWLLGLPGLNRDPKDPTSWLGLERVALTTEIELSDLLFPPPHRPAIDPVPLLLPRWLFERLRDALSALAEGEVQDIFRPALHGRHDDAWSWDVMRRRAIEHIGFLHGTGVTLQMARQRVAAAMKVSPDTLRDWSTETGNKERLQIAKQAGEYQLQLIADPEFGKDGSVPIDAHVLALFISIEKDPLADFGKSYHERFGRRHHSRGAGK